MVAPEELSTDSDFSSPLKRSRSVSFAPEVIRREEELEKEQQRSQEPPTLGSTNENADYVSEVNEEASSTTMEKAVKPLSTPQQDMSFGAEVHSDSTSEGNDDPVDEVANSAAPELVADRPKTAVPKPKVFRCAVAGGATTNPKELAEVLGQLFVTHREELSKKKELTSERKEDNEDDEPLPPEIEIRFTSHSEVPKGLELHELKRSDAFVLCCSPAHPQSISELMGWCEVLLAASSAMESQPLPCMHLVAHHVNLLAHKLVKEAFADQNAIPLTPRQIVEFFCDPDKLKAAMKDTKEGLPTKPSSSQLLAARRASLRGGELQQTQSKTIHRTLSMDDLPRHRVHVLGDSSIKWILPIAAPGEQPNLDILKVRGHWPFGVQELFKGILKDAEQFAREGKIIDQPGLNLGHFTLSCFESAWDRVLELARERYRTKVDEWLVLKDTPKSTDADGDAAVPVPLFIHRRTGRSTHTVPKALFATVFGAGNNTSSPAEHQQQQSDKKEQAAPDPVLDLMARISREVMESEGDTQYQRNKDMAMAEQERRQLFEQRYSEIYQDYTKHADECKALEEEQSSLQQEQARCKEQMVQLYQEKAVIAEKKTKFSDWRKEEESFAQRIAAAEAEAALLRATVVAMQTDNEALEKDLEDRETLSERYLVAWNTSKELRAKAKFKEEEAARIRQQGVEFHSSHIQPLQHRRAVVEWRIDVLMQEYSQACDAWEDAKAEHSALLLKLDRVIEGTDGERRQIPSKKGKLASASLGDMVDRAKPKHRAASTTSEASAVYGSFVKPVMARLHFRLQEHAEALEELKQCLRAVPHRTEDDSAVLKKNPHDVSIEPAASLSPSPDPRPPMTNIEQFYEQEDERRAWSMEVYKQTIQQGKELEELAVKSREEVEQADALENLVRFEASLQHECHRVLGVVEMKLKLLNS